MRSIIASSSALKLISPTASAIRGAGQPESVPGPLTGVIRPSSEEKMELKLFEVPGMEGWISTPTPQSSSSLRTTPESLGLYFFGRASSDLEVESGDPVMLKEKEELAANGSKSISSSVEIQSAFSSRGALPGEEGGDTSVFAWIVFHGVSQPAAKLWRFANVRVTGMGGRVVLVGARPG